MTDAEKLRELQNQINLEKLGTGGYSAVNELLFGLPDFMLKVSDSDKYKELKKMREEYKDAAKIGELLGFAGGMAIPTGAITKLGSKGLMAGAKGAKALKAAKAAELLTKGAKAVDTVGDVAKGTKLVGKGAISQGAARGAAAAAEQAIPRALFKEDQDLGSVGANIALGAGLGAVGGLAGKGLGKVKDAATDQILSNAGVNTRIFKGAKKFGVSKEELADYIVKNKINTPEKLDDLLSLQKAEWDNLFAKYNKEAETILNKPLKEGEFSKKLLDPKRASVKKAEDAMYDLYNREVKLHPEQDKALKKIFKEFSSFEAGEDPARVRAALDRYISAGFKTDDVTKKVQGEFAKKLKDLVDEKVMYTAGGDIPAMKEQYKMLKPLLEAKEAADSTISPLIPGVLNEKAVGVGTGIIAANLMDDRPGMDFGTTAAGALAGYAGSKMLGKAINKVAAKGSEALFKISPKDVGKISELAGKAAGVGSPIKGFAETEDENLPVSSADEEAAVEKQAVETGVKPAETPEEVEEGMPTKSEWMAKNRNEKYESIILGNLKIIWYKNFMKKGVPFDEFVRSMYQSTNGFDPRLSVRLIHEDKKKQAAFLDNMDKIDQINGLDWDKLAKWSPTDQVRAKFETFGLVDPEITRRNAEVARATKILTLLLRASGVTEDKVINSVLPDVERILNSRLPVEEKKERILRMANDFGFNIDDYTGIGVQ